MGETYYLACDMQLFILSPLFIYPLWRWWKVGLGWLIFAIIAVQGGLVTIYIIWNLPAISFPTRPKYLNIVYYKSHLNHAHFYITSDTSVVGNPHLGYFQLMWFRSPPYLFGIILGWILHRTKGSQLKMNKVLTY